MRTRIIRQPATLREQVSEAILLELQNGTFAPGERLTEAKLAQRLEVSRTPIREALAQLSQQGVLQMRDGRGYVVPSPTIDELKDIIEVRLLLEPAAVRMAAREYGKQEVEKISKAIAHEEGAVDINASRRFARANEEFRKAIFGGISNAALQKAIAEFTLHLQFIRTTTLSDLNLRKKIVQRQRQIRDAIAAKDEEKSGALWEAYIRLAEEVLTSTLIESERSAGQ